MAAPGDAFSFPRTGTKMRNRAVLAAMTNKQSHPDGALSDAEINWLLLRAEGGFGIVTTAASHVTPGGQGWVGELGVWGDHQIPGLTKLAAGIRERGAVSMAQIFHGGMRAPEELTGEQPISASENPCTEAHCGHSREVSSEEIEGLITAFGDAAARCAAAGFDGVELHGAHGYLICQFLGDDTNRRDDEWGGDIRSRARFLLRIIAEVRARVPDDFLLGVRISPEYRKIGVRIEDSLSLSQMLVEAGIDFLHISCWDCFVPPSDFPEDPRMITEWFSEELSGSVPIISTGAIWDSSQAQEVMDMGADLVGVARAGVGHSDWASHAADPEYRPARPPFTPEYLAGQGLSKPFIEYMRNWKGFVE